MREVLHKIESSFFLSMAGKETVRNLIWRWGLIAYLSAYFVFDNLIQVIDWNPFDVMICLVMIVYFAWHIYVLRKCAPKKPKLSKEEKKRLRLENRRQMGKKIMRKLLLQESITKWDPVVVAIVIDLFCIAHFFIYI